MADSKKMWGGRFGTDANAAAFALNASIQFDRRMASQDVRGSIAWAGELARLGVISQAEYGQMSAGLNQIAAEFEGGVFTFHESDEDIHTAVERRLAELIGDAAGKLHTGRSRNDQVATDFRLWLLDHLPLLDAALKDLGAALLERAEGDQGVIIPGYTHLQRAQPITLGHWWLSHFWPLMRDRARLEGVRERTSVLPLGSGALAGAPFALDRAKLATALGFDSVSQNSIDGVSDRDFAAEFLFAAAMIGVHLSRMAEGVILFSTAEFGLIELDDAYATGSSLMPQKKNPDHFELARGKAGSLIGGLTGLLATLKGLPSAYDKDLQEDKPPVFSAMDTLLSLLPVLSGALRTLTIHADRGKMVVDSTMLATELADYLVEKGTPFREAHSLAGRVVQLGLAKGISLDELDLTDYQAVSPLFGEDVYQVFDVDAALARRAAPGGTAPAAVAAQLVQARAALVGS